LANWSVQVVSLIWFWGNGQELLAEGPFEDVFGFSPDNITRNKVANPVNGILSSATSLKDGKVSAANVTSGRLEVSIASADDPQSGPTSWELATAQKILSDALDALMECREGRVSQATRLAAHFRMFQSVPSAEHAGRLLLEQIGLPGALGSPLDVVFQINQRAESKQIPGTQLNRLLKFEPGLIQEIVIEPNVGPAGQLAATVERHFANVLIDINTVPAGTSFAWPEQKKLLAEIAGELKRISEAPVPQSLA
jgi:hypothetical protein